jgi:hypothetical protein
MLPDILLLTQIIINNIVYSLGLTQFYGALRIIISGVKKVELVGRRWECA